MKFRDAYTRHEGGPKQASRPAEVGHKPPFAEPARLTAKLSFQDPVSVARADARGNPSNCI
jgi:hypothetical protein